MGVSSLWKTDGFGFFLMSIRLSDISIGRKLGDGAQGIVYEVSSIPGVQLPFAVVYKEFKADVSISPILLENLIRFREELDQRTRTFLDERTTWPVAAVKKGSSTVGYLMRLLCDEYFINLNSPSGAKRNLCEIQLLKKAEDTFREDHGFSVSPADRVRLAYELSRIYNFLHSNELIYGDLNWRNAIWSLSSSGFVTLLDCDGIRKKGSAGPSKQMHSPHWTPPGQKNVQSVETDCYKLALAILRILSPGLNGQFQGSAVSHFRIASSLVSKELISLLRVALDPSTRREEIPTAGEFQRQLKAENPPAPFQVPNRSNHGKPQRRPAPPTSRGGSNTGGHISPPPSGSSGAAAAARKATPATTAFSCSGCLWIAGGIFLLVFILKLVSPLEMASPDSGRSNNTGSTSDLIEIAPSERYSNNSNDSGSPSLNPSPRKNSSSASGKTISGVYGATRSQGNSRSSESPADNQMGRSRPDTFSTFSDTGKRGDPFHSGGKPVRTPVGRPQEFVEIFNQEGKKTDAKIIAAGLLNLVYEDKDGEHFVFPTRSLADQTRLSLLGWEEKGADLQGVIRRNFRPKVGQTFRPWFVGLKGIRLFDGQEQLTVRLDVIHLNGDVTVFHNGKRVHVPQDVLTDDTTARLKEYRRMLGVRTN